MDKHLGIITTPQYTARTDLIFYRINSLLFEFEDYSFSVNGALIKNVNIAHNGNIIVELAFLDINLYNSCVYEDKIISIKETGTAFNPTNKCDEIEYKTSYSNYKFKSMSGSRKDGDWVFVLEKDDEA